MFINLLPLLSEPEMAALTGTPSYDPAGYLPSE